MSLGGEVCFRLARRLSRDRTAGEAGLNKASFSRDSYQDWRRKELEAQYDAWFSADDVKGRDVLDFGCGGGELSLYARTLGARSVIGLEAEPSQLEVARDRLAREGATDGVHFHLVDTPDRIPLPDASVDVILCFDVLEHILDYRAIIPEWARVLRPGGHVLIWWMPYYHPWGHHVESLVPVPWAHVVFSDRSIIEACARVYEAPEFTPRLWDLDGEGRKKPNKWKSMTTLPTLNKLTIGGFERLATRSGLRFARRQFVPISSSSAARAVSRTLISVPGLREFFTGSVVYDLVRR